MASFIWDYLTPTLSASDSCCETDSTITWVNTNCHHTVPGEFSIATDHAHAAIDQERYQDSFYKFHSPEELKLAHANMLDFDHPDAIDMPMFASVSDLRNLCRIFVCNSPHGRSAWQTLKHASKQTYLSTPFPTTNGCRRPNICMARPSS